jgi:phage tail tube protein FII
MSPSATIPARPVIPTGKELYDLIMKDIEPELLSSELPHLVEKYGNETDDQKLARLQRYARAFARFDEAYETYMTHMRQQVKEYRTQAFRFAESSERTDESTMLSSIEHEFNS